MPVGWVADGRFIPHRQIPITSDPEADSRDRTGCSRLTGATESEPKGRKRMIDAQPDFWLGERSEYATTDFDGRLRRCHVLGRLKSQPATPSQAEERSPTTLLWVRLDPPLALDGDEFEEVVLQARHVGNDVARLGDSSISVYVCEIRSKEGFERGHITPSSIRLLAWADVARDRAFLPPTQEEGFDRIFELLRRYAHREGDSNVPPAHREGGTPLGNWVHNMKHSQGRGELRADWADRLAALPGWRWGVDAERDWNVAAGHGSMWLMPPEGEATIGLDSRLRHADPVGHKPPIEAPDGRARLWVYAYPPLRLESEEPGMLLITASQPNVDLRDWAGGPVVVDAAHIRAWRRMADGTRRPDAVLELGRAVVSRDPAVLPPMSQDEWDRGLAALRTYRAQIGHCWVPFDYVPKSDEASVIHLGGWALRVRSEYRQRMLQPGRVTQIEEVPDWRWS